MSQIAYAKVTPGHYVAIVGDELAGRIKMTGHIRGDYSTGFWAYTLNGVRLLREFDTPDDAAETLALEFALHYGDALAGV